MAVTPLRQYSIMPNELIEYADDVVALVDGGYRSDDGVAWLERLAQRVVDDSAPTGTTVLVAPRPGRDGWHVSILVADRPLALIDVHAAADTDAAAVPMSGLDHVLVKAVEQWRLVTRVGELGDVRPWLGCVRIEERSSTDQTGDRAMASLVQMVNERKLDSACLVVIDPETRWVSHPNPAMSLAAFVASLLGRCRYWAALLSPGG